jgi:hypothetical protein
MSAGRKESSAGIHRAVEVLCALRLGTESLEADSVHGLQGRFFGEWEVN